MAAAQSRTWTWHFDASPEQIWAVLADTPRFNEAAGWPKYRVTEAPQADGSVIYTGHGRAGPFALTWRELPFEFVANQRFRNGRQFHSGPLRWLSASLAVHPDGAGCRADYRLEVEPANWIGRLLLSTGFFPSAGKTVNRLAAEAAAFVTGKRGQPFEVTRPPLDEAAQNRLSAGLAQLEAAGPLRALVRRLGDEIKSGSEVDLAHMRPLRLARLWRAPERDVIELCLWAVKVGLLEMHWDLLCPNCRGPKLSVASLDRLPQGAHCPSCNIDYARDFARNVEMTFRPAPAIRAIRDGEFCLLGPTKTPHVVVQQTLAAGEMRDVPARLGQGDYRVRGLHPHGEALVTWTEGGFPATVVTPDGVVAGGPSPPGMVRMENRLDREITLVVESRDWVRDALTAHRVTLMQAFRDLFATEVLRAGDQVSIANVTLMFTDLRGSTALYSRIGDGRAYGLVRDHFAYLADTVRRHDGAVIKTIGDAVMAAFSDPAQAVRAALDAQRNVARFNREHGEGIGEAVVIKLGMHAGPCIAVNLNDRLDYFGTAVNLAARLQGESSGGDIVISAALAADPAVVRELAAEPSSLEQAVVKGFDRPVAFLRIRCAVSEDTDKL